MTMNRLISPSSEHAMPDWICRSALGDILGKDCAEFNDDALYRNLDLLHIHRKEIEEKPWDNSRTLFNLDNVKQEMRFLAALEKLSISEARGSVKQGAKVYERLGRLKEWYSPVARYYKITYDEQKREIVWKERARKTL